MNTSHQDLMALIERAAFNANKGNLEQAKTCVSHAQSELAHLRSSTGEEGKQAIDSLQQELSSVQRHLAKGQPVGNTYSQHRVQVCNPAWKLAKRVGYTSLLLMAASAIIGGLMLTDPSLEGIVSEGYQPAVAMSPVLITTIGGLVVHFMGKLPRSRVVTFIKVAVIIVMTCYCWHQGMENRAVMSFVLPLIEMPMWWLLRRIWAR